MGEEHAHSQTTQRHQIRMVRTPKKSQASSSSASQKTCRAVELSSAISLISEPLNPPGSNEDKGDALHDVIEARGGPPRTQKAFLACPMEWALKESVKLEAPEDKNPHGNL